MRWIQNDGGRADAGFKGNANDCVVRAIAITTGLPYRTIYNRIQKEARAERPTARGKRSAPRSGVFTTRKWFKAYMAELGFTWVPTMGIGTGCTVHLVDGELPHAKLIAKVSRHFCAVIYGNIHDTFDPGREGDRCVYGYWVLA